MSQELTTPPNFMDNIREKIKNSFVELVPDETWDAMVKQEIENFFEKPTNFKIDVKTTGWGSHQTKEFVFKFEGDEDVKPTMFRTMVWDMCMEKTKTYIEAEHIQNIIHTALEERHDDATGKTESLIEKAIPIMINKYFESIAINMTNNLAEMVRANMANGAYQQY